MNEPLFGNHEGQDRRESPIADTKLSNQEQEKLEKRE